MGHAMALPSDTPVLRSHPRMTFQSGPYSFEIVSEGAQSLYRVSDGKETISEPILYAFGNAHIGQTYVYRHNGQLYEGRMSYYRVIDSLDWTIGDALNPPLSLEQAAGRDMNSDEARNCFSCHGTASTVANKLNLDRLIPGVSCEACHGPAASHVAAMSSGDKGNLFIFNPKKLDPETLSQEFCGTCHRGVDAVGMMPDLGGPNNVRFQPYRLYNSRGHNPGDPRFACTACHDPHVELRPGDPVYDSNCIACHAAQNTGAKATSLAAKRSSSSQVAKPCPIGKDRCVSCHMPKVALPGAHFQFTDHRIRIPRPGQPYPL
jgi:Cytochrome c554 and c-prime